MNCLGVPVYVTLASTYPHGSEAEDMWSNKAVHLIISGVRKRQGREALDVLKQILSFKVAPTVNCLLNSAPSKYPAELWTSQWVNSSIMFESLIMSPYTNSWEERLEHMRIIAQIEYKSVNNSFQRRSHF